MGMRPETTTRSSTPLNIVLPEEPGSLRLHLVPELTRAGDPDTMTNCRKRDSRFHCSQARCQCGASKWVYLKVGISQGAGRAVFEYWGQAD